MVLKMKKAPYFVVIINYNEPLVKPKVPNAIENPYIKIKKEKHNDNFLEPNEGDNKISTKQLLGLIGFIFLFVGVFAPIISVPIIGNMNYFQNGSTSKEPGTFPSQ